MREAIAAAVFGVALMAGTAAAAAPRVEIKDAVARVTVIPEDRSDIAVEFLTTNKALPMEVDRYGDKTVIDGDIRHNRIYSCSNLNGVIRVGVKGVGQIEWKDLPQIVVRTPRDVDVSSGGAVFGSIGRSANVEINNAGCGDWTIGNTQGRLSVSQAGSGDTRAGSAGSADVRVAGSGNVTMTQVAGDLTADIAGSGDIHAGSINGNLKTRIAGSGDVSVDQGRARRMDVSIAGSGDVSFGGVTDSLDAQVMGSGDVHVTRVSGEVHKQVMGSGEVSVGR